MTLYMKLFVKGNVKPLFVGIKTNKVNLQKV